MLHVFFGNDVVKVRDRAFKFLHTATGEDTLVTRVTPETFEVGMLRDLIGGTSLFGSSQTVVLDTLSECGAEIFEDVIASLESMRDSENQFIVIEGPLTAPHKKRVEGKATETFEISGEKAEKFNTFLMTDALLRRDRKSLWLLLQEAWREGVSNEEIAGILFWQLKVLRLVLKTSSAEEAGQKPFVYGKAKRALGSFKEGELEKLSGDLLEVYHDGHLGKHDFGLALEKWTLTV